MKSAEDIRRYFQKSTLSTNPDEHEAIFEKIQRAQEQSITDTPASCRIPFGSSIMKSSHTRMAAAAAIVAAAILGYIIFAGTGAKTAYCNSFNTTASTDTQNSKSETGNIVTGTDSKTAKEDTRYRATGTCTQTAYYNT